jgi:glycosyltransferase involved in cell wall biosynthesis
MVEFLDKMGVPQIWEADDNWYTIGPYNRASYLSNREDIPKWLKLCKNATVTRKELGEFYKTLYPELKYHILPNSVDFEVWPKTTYTTGDILKGDKLRLGWTGCDSHRDDLAIVIPALKELKKKYKDKLEIVIFGWNGELDPKFNMPNVFEGLDITHYGPVIYEEYANKLCSLNLDVAFIPLANNTFNNTGKSNLKYLDVSASRIPCAVSDCNLYGDTKDMETGIIVKDSEWFDKLDMLLRDRELRLKLSNNAYNYVHDTYDMAKTVHLWTNAYMECASKYKVK